MIDRLALIVLLAGCVLFAAITAAEVIATPAAPTEIAADRSQARSPPPSVARAERGPPSEAIVAEILARPLFSATRRPPAKSEGATVDFRAGRHPPCRDCHHAGSSVCDLRSKRSQTSHRQRRRHHKRLAYRSDNASGSIADRAHRDKNSPAKDRPDFGAASSAARRRAAAGVPTQQSGIRPADPAGFPGAAR